MYTCNHVLLQKHAWHDHRMQPVFDPDLTLQYFPPLNMLPATCPGNEPVHRSQGSDAMEDDGMQFAWQDTCSRTETFFKSLQSSSTSIFGLNLSKIDRCAMRRMPCSKFLISKLSYPIPSVFPPQEVALQQLSRRFVVCSKQRAALLGILETFVT